MIKPVMNIAFIGFYDSSLESQEDVEVVACVFKNRCKETNDERGISVQEDSIRRTNIPVNPSENCADEVRIISLTLPSFFPHDNQNSSYSLLLRVACGINVKPRTKRGKLYGCQITVIDRYSRFHLRNGKYHCGLQELKNGKLPPSPTERVGWVNIEEKEISSLQNCRPFEVFNMSTKIKFNLTWTDKVVEDSIERPIPVETKENLCPLSEANHSSRHTTKRRKLDRCARILYNFPHHYRTGQQTKIRDDYRCLWCGVNCIQLYSLLNHLHTCHCEFKFTYTRCPDVHFIDVSLKDNFDVSYNGNPEDVMSQPELRGQSTSSFEREDAARVNPFSSNHIVGPKWQDLSRSDFLNLEEANVESQKLSITGHKRLYHHTTTYLPIHSPESDLDSEEENDPEWLRKKMQKMIDDFTDVNEGEKELLKMWNLHVLKNRYVGDRQISRACETFMHKKGVELWRKRLYRNFVLHMANLNDLEILGQSAMIKIVNLARNYTSMGVNEITAS